MKRHVLFALLCLGLCSVLAIAASIPEPVRILSKAEKAHVIGGCFYNCAYLCISPYFGCVSDAWCQGMQVGTNCGNVRANIVPKCSMDGGNLLGQCETSKLNVCFMNVTCSCQWDDSDFVCGVNSAFTVAWVFSKIPC